MARIQDASPASTMAVFGLQRVMTPICVWKLLSMEETFSPRAKSCRVGFGGAMGDCEVCVCGQGCAPGMCGSVAA